MDKHVGWFVRTRVGTRATIGLREPATAGNAQAGCDLWQIETVLDSDFDRDPMSRHSPGVPTMELPSAIHSPSSPDGMAKITFSEVLMRRAAVASWHARAELFLRTEEARKMPLSELVPRIIAAVDRIPHE